MHAHKTPKARPKKDLSGWWRHGSLEHGSKSSRSYTSTKFAEKSVACSAALADGCARWRRQAPTLHLRHARAFPRPPRKPESTLPSVDASAATNAMAVRSMSNSHATAAAHALPPSTTSPPQAAVGPYSNAIPHAYTPQHQDIPKRKTKRLRNSEEFAILYVPLLAVPPRLCACGGGSCVLDRLLFVF